MIITHNIISKYLFIFMLLLFIFVHSFAIAGDATSFDPTSVAVEPKAISGVPIGGVIPWTSGTVPEGFLECNGQSTTGYADLAAIVGGTVPDLRGEFIRGWDHGRGADSGRSLRSSQSQAYQSHSHSFTLYSMSGGSIAAGGYAEIDMNWANGNNQAAYGHSTTSAGGTETRPRNVAMMYIIKAE